MINQKIGGGSGGIACARRAASYGAKVGLADFVEPSPIGTKWGLGGTCVNVGCIPKKLMHYAAGWGAAKEDMTNAGWSQSLDNHNWEALVQAVQNHIKSLNFNYTTTLHTENLVDKGGKVSLVKSDAIVIAVGGRPNYLDIPNAQQTCITSDDIFSMQKPPGATLLVGASYVSLEIAGILHGLGFPTTVMVRSILLRGFDQEMAGLIGKYMEEVGIRFIEKSIPEKIEMLPDGKREVFWTTEEGTTVSETFDTVVLAIGRHAVTQKLNLEAIGVKTDKNGKVITNDADESSIKNIYALGDCAKDRPELTPTAIMAGRLLADRLFPGKTKLMDYKYHPTTVFTPLEYGAIGYSEEDAIKEFGKSNIEVFYTQFTPLEWVYANHHQTAFAKLVCLATEQMRIVGFHFVGPNAGEVTQGYAVAIKMGATKEHFSDTVGIHPTVSESIVQMEKVKTAAPIAAEGGC